jgi:hypothetical protein
LELFQPAFRDVSRGKLQAVRHRGDDVDGAGEKLSGVVEEICEGVNHLKGTQKQ